MKTLFKEKAIFALLLPVLMIIGCDRNTHVVYQWHGPDRDGIYPGTGLLKIWPEEGPTLLWKYEGIGNGYSSPTVTADQIFVPGEIDSIGYLFSFDRDGNLLWKKDIGPEWTKNYPGPRSTPTVIDDHVYVISGMGKLVCLETSSGKMVWFKEMMKDLHGRIIRFGISESPLIEGDMVFCFPGGKDTNLVALNRFNGQLIWVSPGVGDSTAYCSPSLIRLPDRSILTTFSMHHFIGIDATTGELLWSQKFDRESDVHCNTPYYEEGFIYLNNRAGNGVTKLQLSVDGSSIKEVWRYFEGGNVQSGFVKVGDYLYGSRYRPPRYEAIDATTGDVSDSLKFGVGATIFADSLLYCYGEKGTFGLIKPENGNLELVSTFKVTEGTKEHFAHPVIYDGTLFIRHGNTLLAYDIKEN
ncbi:PQQ-binding-like beta-propeller repeat protein [Bacteroidota bacterium]